LLRLAAATDNAANPNEPPKSDPPKRKRRRFQFRLRTLMIGLRCWPCHDWLNCEVVDPSRFGIDCF
jgi:hypothetical protein